MSDNSRKEFDLLIIGCGISGLTAALFAAENGLNVAVISKEADLHECNTHYAQGGIVCSGKDDSPAKLIDDIINAGDKLNFKEAVELIAREGPILVKELLIRKIGIPFCLQQSGELDYTKEAAHSLRRIIHVKDRTGQAIEQGMQSYASKVTKIHFFSNHCAIDLITNSHNSLDFQEKYRRTRVIGAYVLDTERQEVKIFFAPAVILATGGAGNLYLHTSNSAGATGDGIAMAYRIGAEIINTEYIQFHPTILFHRDVKRFLISESLRGEGARLMNKNGEYFVEKYCPVLKDLAPRDEVARAIFKEMELTSTEYVLLDTRLVKNHDLEERFPGIYKQCQAVGIDIRREPIPVVPAAHYFCGGIKVNLQARTVISGLYAVGENSCTGVHGANRLASVSLLEGLYFGMRASLNAVKSIKKLSATLKRSIPDWVYPAPEKEFDPLLINQDIWSIRSTMWNYAGIVRREQRLLRALADLNYLSHRIERFYRQAKLTRKIIELRNSVLSATLIVRAANANHISRGCHYIE